MNKFFNYYFLLLIITLSYQSYNFSAAEEQRTVVINLNNDNESELARSNAKQARLEAIRDFAWQRILKNMQKKHGLGVSGPFTNNVFSFLQHHQQVPTTINELSLIPYFFSLYNNPTLIAFNQPGHVCCTYLSKENGILQLVQSLDKNGYNKWYFAVVKTDSGEAKRTFPAELHTIEKVAPSRITYNQLCATIPQTDLLYKLMKHASFPADCFLSPTGEKSAIS